MKTYQHILVPVDFSPASRDALDSALAIASSGTRIELVHTWMRVPGLADGLSADVTQSLVTTAKRSMQRFVSDTAVPEGVTLSTRIIEADAARTIIEMSQRMDLIVMGTHGRTGLNRFFMGSTAERVVREASCPVMTVRNPATGRASDDDAPTMRMDAVDEKAVDDDRTIHALVDNGGAMQSTLARLIAAGIPAERITVMMNETEHERDLESIDHTKAKEGAAAGGILGGTVGGIVGGLAGLGTVVTTGGLALLILGPTVGLAAVGGALGGYLGRGMPDDQTKVLHGQLAEGRRLVAVHPVDDAQHSVARSTLEEAGAQIVA